MHEKMIRRDDARKRAETAVKRKAPFAKRDAS
jgi:hypothetical protein